MPWQNRVNPFGGLIGTECRGTLMGNRGCLHDDSRHIRRAFVGRRWITCVLEFHGRHRAIMTPGRYTELFFLDEATALAAGHRPCAECQRERYLLFRDFWAAANPGLSSYSADDIDLVLHHERVTSERGKRTYPAQVSELPPGVMVADDEHTPYLVHERHLMRWEPCGYVQSIPRPRTGMFHVLTPKSITLAILRGYPVELHPSAVKALRQ